MGRDPHALDLKYTTSIPSATRHHDGKPPKLTDGRWKKSSKDSVQYDGNVSITADLGAPKDVSEARIVLYHRPSDFSIEKVDFAISADGTNWSAKITQKRMVEEECDYTLGIPVSNSIRCVRFDITRNEGTERVLVGEIELIGANKPVTEARKSDGEDAVTPDIRPVTPMQVKRTLDEALLAAKVDFLYGCYPTDVLRDDAGNLCGIVMANRAGRQAVRAKVIIDATPRAVVARLAGAKFTGYTTGEHLFRRIAVGGKPKSTSQFSVKTLPFLFAMSPKKGAVGTPVFEYSLKLEMKDAGDHSLAEADQISRDLIWQGGQLDIAEELFEIPPDPVKSVHASVAGWSGVEKMDLDAFRPAGVSRLFVLGGCAEISREAAEKFLRPHEFMAAGRRIGQAAATDAKRITEATVLPKVASAEPDANDSIIAGDVKEFLAGIRPTQKGLPVASSPKRELPILGRYDVVVVGGGTGGAPGGIGAAKGGAKTLLIEYQTGLGGVGTLGRISRYYHGYRGGFTGEVEEGLKEFAAANPVAGKTEWWRQTNRKAGTEIWFGCLGIGAVVVENTPHKSATKRVVGVVVATPRGRGVVLANTVIDSTGNSDIAAIAAGAWDYTGAAEVSVQGTGLPPLELGDDYTNTDWTFADDTDIVDFWHHFVIAREKYHAARDLGQLMDTRERRRIIGDVTISPMDIILSRIWPDTINIAHSNFDTHGFTVHPIFYVMPPDKIDITANVPLRALMPKGVDGILVTGLGVSAHRDSMPIIRMQPDVQNQGFACGTTAAFAAQEKKSIREIDFSKVQSMLVEKGILPPEALNAKDSLPVTSQQIKAAVDLVVMRPPDQMNTSSNLIQDRHALAILFAQPKESVPLLEKAYAKAEVDDKLAYAHILAMMGNATGAQTLLEKVRRAKDCDKGWNYVGMGQFGRSVSELDAYIIALGMIRAPGAEDVILEKLAQLDDKKEFSHHRACAMALESLGDPRAAAPLAELLKKPGMTGYSTTTIDEARNLALAARTDNATRNVSLREICLARALYRCGDKEGLGESILHRYANDLRGHFARHVQAVLEKGPSTLSVP